MDQLCITHQAAGHSSRDFKGESNLFGSEIKFRRHLACCHFCYYDVQGDLNLLGVILIL